MVEEESKLRNRIGNVKKTPTRLVKTVAHYGTDLMKCLSGAVDDFGGVLEKRKEKRKKLFSKDKKRYQKALNVPVFGGVFVVSQGEKLVKPLGRLAENVVTSSRNAARNLKNSIGGVFSNKPVSNFAYSDLKLTQEKLDTENVAFFNPNTLWTRNRGNRSNSPKKSSNKTENKTGASSGGSGSGGSSSGGVEEIEDSDRMSSEIPEGIELSDRGQTMVNYIKKSHPELTIEFDDSTTWGHVKGPKSGNKIIVGSKKKEDVQQILYHEITHVMINDDVEGIQELINSIKTINQKKGKQLFSVSNHKHYDTPEKKTVEDTCELLALYSRSDWKFDKYMKKLQCGDDIRLAKIEKSEAKHLKELCENVMSGLKTIKFNKDELIDMAA